MGQQADIIIGEKVRNHNDIRRILKIIAPTINVDVDDDALEDVAKMMDVEKSITWQGETFKVEIHWHDQSDGQFPFHEREEDTWSAVGMQLTGRYFPKIIDRGQSSDGTGKPNPFVLRLDDLSTVLKEVREWWPDAEVMMMDSWY